MPSHQRARLREVAESVGGYGETVTDPEKLQFDPVSGEDLQTLAKTVVTNPLHFISTFSEFQKT